MSMTTGQILKNLLFHGQSFLVYPSGFVSKPRYVYTPAHYNFRYEDLKICTPDKVTLSCYYMQFHEASPNKTWPPDTKGRGTVIMFHGNALDHGYIIPLAKEFLSMRFDVITVSYRGYADSSGTPSEKGLRTDAQAVLDYVFADQEKFRLPVIIYGQSLGGAVAIDLTSKRENHSKIAALIIENTFKSIPDIVSRWPYIGNLSFLCTHKWKSASKIPLIPKTLPILMLSGLRDIVVPPEHMSDLWELATRRGKPEETPENVPENIDEFVTFRSGNHEDTFMASGYWAAIGKFLDKVDRQSTTV